MRFRFSYSVLKFSITQLVISTSFTAPSVPSQPLHLALRCSRTKKIQRKWKIYDHVFSRPIVKNVDVMHFTLVEVWALRLVVLLRTVIKKKSRIEKGVGTDEEGFSSTG